jgi:hypothetical protein
VFSDFKLEEIREVGASDVVYDTKLRKFTWPPPGGVEVGQDPRAGHVMRDVKEGRRIDEPFTETRFAGSRWNREHSSGCALYPEPPGNAGP